MVVTDKSNASAADGIDAAPRSQNLLGYKTVLLLAYHFPPDATSTGRLRTLSFARHLPAFGWRPVVLSPKPIVYKRVDPDSVADIPDTTPVHRSFALDARRHLSWRGKYPAWLAVPDRWIWWWPSAVLSGLRLIRRYRVDAIWSTYPIATTQLIALTLAKLTRLPWIADFRDPVVVEGTTAQRRALRFMERHTLARADRVVFTAPGARTRYARRYHDSAGRFSVIPNGYEQTDLPSVVGPPSDSRARRRLRLVHSGLLYPRGRNPAAFFEALAELKSKGTISPDSIEIVLRASGHEAKYQSRLNRLAIDDLVVLAPPLAYREALREQAGADALVLFQGPEFNAQIPAKVFEYLCIARPILALTDTGGDTAALLADTGGATLAPIGDKTAIAEVLSGFIRDLRAGGLPAINRAALEQYSRRTSARYLAQRLDEITESA